MDGGIYSRGRHVRGNGFERDAEKRNAAPMAGWEQSIDGGFQSFLESQDAYYSVAVRWPGDGSVSILQSAEGDQIHYHITAI